MEKTQELKTIKMRIDNGIFICLTTEEKTASRNRDRCIFVFLLLVIVGLSVGIIVHMIRK